MKKLFSLILSLVMILGVSSVTFADTNPKIYEDTPKIDLAKIYKLANDGVKNPDEIFEFTIVELDPTDSLYTKDTMPKLSGTTYKISFTEGEATLVKVGDTFTGDKNITTIDLPTYDHVGIFTYKITETVGTTAGVTYDTNPLYLKVTVIEQNGQKIRVAALHYGTEDGKKTDSITNTYSAGNLSISKIVTGNMGEKDRYFAIDVTLKAPANKDVKSTISISETSYRDANSNGNPTSITVGETTTFYLKDGETITLGNIPYDVTYTVVEKDYNGYGYDTAEYTYSDQGEIKAIDTASETVNITNNKGRDVDTGIFVDNLPYIVILGIVIVGMGAFFIKKRTANNN